MDDVGGRERGERFERAAAHMKPKFSPMTREIALRCVSKQQSRHENEKTYAHTTMPAKPPESERSETTAAAPMRIETAT